MLKAELVIRQVWDEAVQTYVNKGHTITRIIDHIREVRRERSNRSVLTNHAFSEMNDQLEAETTRAIMEIAIDTHANFVAVLTL